MRIQKNPHFLYAGVNKKAGISTDFGQSYFLSESMTLATAFKTEAADSKTMLIETASTNRI